MKNPVPQSLAVIAVALLFAGCNPKTLPRDTKSTPPTLTILSPTPDCPQDGPPVFSWTAVAPAPGRVVYGLRLVELKEKQDADEALRSNEAIYSRDNIAATRLKYPERLRPGAVYAFRVYAYDAGASPPKPIGQSETGLFFTTPSNLPFSLEPLLCCAHNLLSDDVSAWAPAYGTPAVNTKQGGCFQNTGVVEMKGNAQAGDAIRQPLGAGLKIEKGKRYQFSFCARAYPKQLDHIRFRVLAYNGNLPATGGHPEPGANITVAGETGNITSEGWNRYFLPSWQAPKDYANVAILAMAGEGAPAGALANGALSGICLEVTDDCGFTAESLGITNPGDLPERIENALLPGTAPQTLDVGFGQGPLLGLYGYPFDENGQSTWYTTGDECVSIGGTAPPEALDKEKEESGYELPGGLSMEGFDEALKKYGEWPGFEVDFPKWGRVPPEKAQECRPNYDKNKPFSGRDIVYVHGLRPDHIYQNIIKRDQTGYLSAAAAATGFLDPATLDDALTQKWPEARDEFFEGGFYHQQAKNYFYPHIEHFLGDTVNPGNRFLIVSYNSSQRLAENLHAIFWQISRAMNEGEGVVYAKDDPRGARCFGQDYVIVSHSTGALVMDAALAVAQLSATDGAIRDAFGEVQYIARRAKAHISLHGAISGSEMAGLAVAGANVAALTATGGDIGVDVGIAVDNGIATGEQMLIDALTGLNTAGTTNNTDAFEAFMDAVTDSAVVITQNAVTVVNNSILVDLTPSIAKLQWGPFLDQTPAPVLTIAGGHPGALDHSLATKWVLRGLDDGVVGTNSQSGSPSLVHPDFYGYIPPAGRIYDMGIAPQRAAVFYAGQYITTALAAYGSFPFLSPDGMLQPIAIAPAPSPRYNNHFPFIQSTADHNHPMAPTTPYLSTFGAANTEESLVAENNFIFSSGLVNPTILSSMRQTVLGQDLVLTFSINYPVFQFPPPSFSWQQSTFTLTVPIWRRTYRRLSDGWRETDYVYRFVLR